jgi:hypothetical protein
MALNIGKEIAALKRMTVSELRDKHIEVFGEENRSRHKEYLVKRIAWRIQSQAEGDLSERAKQRALKLATDADLRTRAPDESTIKGSGKTKTVPVVIDHDSRLPMHGAIITREYKGETIQVMVLPKGFEYEGEIYKTLSAVAKAITGSHWNGFHFFNLKRKGKTA